MNRLLYPVIKDRSGMTLVEVLVAMTIAVVVVTAAGGIFLFSANLSGKMGEMGIGKMKGDGLAEFVERQLKFAVQIQITCDEMTEAEAGYNHVLKFGQNGMVYLDGEDLYGKNYYEGCRLVFTVEQAEESSRVLSFDVDVMEAEEGVYSCRSSVRLANIGLKPEWKIRCDADSGGTMASDEADLYIYYRLEQN